MEKPSFTKLEVYQLADQVSDKVWDIVDPWSYFHKDTIGKQLVRSADSVLANIVEGYGRFTYVENKRFNHIARGSLCETYVWIEKARKRKLIKEEDYLGLNKQTVTLMIKLNKYINGINSLIKQSQSKPI